MFFIPGDFSTDKVLLRPMEPHDFNDFLLLSQDADMWKFFSLNLADPTQLKKWMDAAFREQSLQTRIPLTILEKASGRIIGSTSMGNISEHDLRLEIGWSWLGREFRGTGLNRHCKFTLMQFAFDQLMFERIEFKTDVLNVRARKGLQKIGAQEEGILRSHMTMWNNRRRDSIYFSVLKYDWPKIQQTFFKDLIS